MGSDRRIFDCVIIGAGPAGLGAAIYAARAGFDVLLIEKNPISGGQIVNTSEVDNYLGLPGIGGFELGQAFHKHVSELKVDITQDDIKSIMLDGDIKVLTGDKDQYYSRTLVLAMGAHHSKLNVPGEKEYMGMGVSYCATCDGAFFRKKKTIVVGGGDVAVEDAIFLSNMCEQVTLIHRRDSLRAAQVLQDTLFSKSNVNVVWNSTIEEISGDGFVNGVVVKNSKDGSTSTLETSGVFIAVGMEPETDIVRDLVVLDDRGYIVAGEDCRTNIPGIYAAGDIRTKDLRQVITAVADGATSIHSAAEYLR